MNSSTSRPLAVIIHPPLMRSTSVEAGHPRRKELGPVRPIAAAGRQDGHVALEVLHDGKAIRIAHQNLEDRNLEARPTPDRSAPHRGCAGQGFTADLPETICRNLASSDGFQDLRGNVSTCSDFAVRDAFADFVENRAQKRGGCRVEHELPPGGNIPF